MVRNDEFSFQKYSQQFYYASKLIDEIKSENQKEVQILLEVCKADPNAVVPEHGCAALHLLAGWENEDFSEVVTLQVLLKSDGDPNVRSEEGLTPVHVAAIWGRCRVLEILLANGGDPTLLDYRLLLDAEEYALRERQWYAYGVINSFSLNSPQIYPMDCNDETFSLERDKSLEYSSIVCNDRFSDFDDTRGNEDEEEIRGSMKNVPLNRFSMEAIRKHRRKTDVYETHGPSGVPPLNLEDLNSSRSKFEKEYNKYGNNFKRYSPDSTKSDENWKYTNIVSKELQVGPELELEYFGGNSKNKHESKNRHENIKTYNNTFQNYDINEEGLKDLTLNQFAVDTIKRQRRNCEVFQDDDKKICLPSERKRRSSKGKHRRQEESETYFCRVAESSVFAKSTSRPPGSTRRPRYTSVSSSVDSEKYINNKMLCKMSRIFLFMLKKKSELKE